MKKYKKSYCLTEKQIIDKANKLCKKNLKDGFFETIGKMQRNLNYLKDTALEVEICSLTFLLGFKVR